jgi:hypothetical protein
MDIPEQHEIKTIFTSSTKLNTLQLFYNNKNLCSIAAQPRCRVCLDQYYLQAAQN